MRPDQTLELVATGLDDAGAGVAEADGIRVHVADLLPGERATVAIDHVSPHRPEAWARCLARAGAASPDRVAPACPAWGACGGCAWQHLAYPAQLELKRQRVAAALGRAVDPVVPSPATRGYRNKGKYVIGELDGALMLGAYRPRSHALVATTGCCHVDPAVDRAAQQVREALAGSGLPAYDEARRAGVWRYLVARADAAGQVLVHLVTATGVDAAALAPIAGALLGDPIAGVTWSAHDKRSGAILGGESRALAGRATLGETLSGVELAVDATAFLQVNRDQAARIYRDLADAVGAGPGTRAVDLYGGVGGIALALAARGAEVVAIEAQPAAVAAARAAAPDRVRFECAEAAALATLVRGPIDVLAVNPPRKGLDAATRAAVIASAPRAIAYLSCGPDSLARDLAALAEAGYSAERITPYDLMPGTSQVETLVILRAATP